MTATYRVGERRVFAEIGPFQALLDAIGWFLAWLYDLVGNYGVAIIVLTLAFRLVLLPLGIKQIKSMQAMQALQPKIKEIQKKYKGNKQKAQEQTMKLYQDYGINPLGGCLPLLLQLPILFAFYAVIRAPLPYAEEDPDRPAGSECDYASDAPLPGACFSNNHLPEESQLFVDVTEHNDENLHFLLMNLQCSPSNAGKTVPVRDTQGQEVEGERLHCGDSIPDAIPYYLMLVLMFGTTLYSTRQSQRATPASAQTQQQKMISRIMPITFGVFGWAFPAGLLVYWIISNAFQIGQQSVMLKLGHIGPEAMDRRLAEVKAKAAAKGDKPRSGFMGSIMERAEQERKRRQGDTTTGRKPPPRGSSGKGQGGSPTRPKGGPNRPKGSGPKRPKRRGR
jgi:YidC/Oxa1 family membrane protein insertase